MCIEGYFKKECKRKSISVWALPCNPEVLNVAINWQVSRNIEGKFIEMSQ